MSHCHSLHTQPSPAASSRSSPAVSRHSPFSVDPQRSHLHELSRHYALAHTLHNIPAELLLPSRRKILRYQSHWSLHFLWHHRLPAAQSQLRKPVLPSGQGRGKSFRFRSTDPTRFHHLWGLHTQVQVRIVSLFVPGLPGRMIMGKSDILHFRYNL